MIRHKKNTSVAGRHQADQQHLQHRYAEWFGSIRWNWYMTMTFDREVSRQQAWALFKEYVDQVERDRRCCVGALVVLESKQSGLGKPSSGFHFHAVLKAPQHITAEYFKEVWETRRYGGSWCRQRCIQKCECGECKGGALRCCPYNPSENAVSYLLKELNTEPDNWFLHRGYLFGIRPKSWHKSARVRRSVKRDEDRRRLTREVR